MVLVFKNSERDILSYRFSNSPFLHFPMFLFPMNGEQLCYLR